MPSSSPIVIDTTGNGFSLTALEHGIFFDIDANGTAPTEQVSWTSTNSDDAFLALDRNDNGIIDDGSELFGNFTFQCVSPNPNGFIALAEYDEPANGGNGNGEIESNDTVFTSLRLWKDVNHNGVSESTELYTLLSLNVSSIDLNYKESKRTDEFGNYFRYRAKVRDTRGAQVGRWAYDVFLFSSQ